MPEQSSQIPSPSDPDSTVGSSTTAQSALPAVKRSAEQRRLITLDSNCVTPGLGKKGKRNSLGDEAPDDAPTPLLAESLSDKFTDIATLPSKERITSFFKLVESTSNSNTPQIIHAAIRETERKLGKPLPVVLLDDSRISPSASDIILDRYFTVCCSPEVSTLQRQRFAEYVLAEHESKIQSLTEKSIEQTAQLEALFLDLDEHRHSVLRRYEIPITSGASLISIEQISLLRSLESHNPLLIELLEKAKTSYLSLTAINRLSFEEQHELHNLFKDQDSLLCKISELKESISAIESAIVAENNQFARLYERFVAKELPNKRRSSKAGFVGELNIQYHSFESSTPKKTDNFIIYSDKKKDAESGTSSYSQDVEPIIEDEKTPFEMRSDADKERSIAEDCARRFVLSGDFANAEASITAYNNRFPQFQISSDFLGPLKEKILKARQAAD